jgi:DNA-binding transcriptional regulator YiaG
MPNIAAVLKQDISRISRKEVRGLMRSLQKASAQFRRDIAALKRQDSQLKAVITRLERSNRASVQPKTNGADTEKVRFTVRSVKSQRERLGISAADYGSLIGVSAATVYKWEHGTSKPRRAQLSSLAALRSLGKREARRRLEAGKAKGH